MREDTIALRNLQRFQQPVNQQSLEGSERIFFQQQRRKLKAYMHTLASKGDDLSLNEALVTADLARVPLDEAQQTLLFTSPMANRYASTWDPNSPRSKYGLECSPRSIKSRAFHNSLDYSMLKPTSVESHLRMYAMKEASAIAAERAREEEARQAAQARPTEVDKGQSLVVQPLTDDQLRMVHKTVKTRLATKFNGVASAFRDLDRDGTGTITPQECVEAMMRLNVGVPRKFIEHLVNMADYDRDGEINYQEFSRILNCDDITTIKPPEDADKGPAKSTKELYWKPGITRQEMISSANKFKDMLLERGGHAKMFRKIDEDKSGKCSRKEIRWLTKNLNLETVIRPEVLEALIDLMDVDNDDQIGYVEFSRILNSDDPLSMPAATTVSRENTEEQKPKKLTKAERKLRNKIDVGLR